MKLIDIFKRLDRRTVKRKTGDRGEDAAVKYLEENHYDIRCRNWRFGKNEIDIIAQKFNTIVFVEVKTTSSDYAESFKLPSEAVTKEKQRKIIEAARVYMGRLWEYERTAGEIQSFKASIYHNCRFDVIEVYLNRTTPEINHIENAFYAEKGNKRKWKT